MIKFKKLYKGYEEIINYLIVGILTTLVSLVSKWALLFTILDPKNAVQLQTAVIISWILAVTFAYITNKVFVFKSKDKNILKELILFFIARLFTLGFEMFIMYFFVTCLKLDSDIWVFILTIISQILIMLFNYIFSKLIIFKKN